MSNNPLSSSVKTVSSDVSPEALDALKGVIRLNVDIDEAIYDDFKAICQTSGITISEVIRELVRSWTLNHPLLAPVKQLKATARKGLSPVAPRPKREKPDHPGTDPQSS